MKNFCIFSMIFLIFSCGVKKKCPFIIDEGNMNSKYDLELACQSLSKIENHYFYIFYQSKIDTSKTIAKIIEKYYNNVYYSTESWSILIINCPSSSLYMANSSKVMNEQSLQKLSKIRREVYSNLKQNNNNINQIVKIIKSVWYANQTGAGLP